MLDVHPVARGDRVGYRQRRIARTGTLLVVSRRDGARHRPGGAVGGRVGRASGRASLAKGGLEAAGRSLSPYIVAGKQRWFVEPPHMQVSMIPSRPGDVVPEVGDEVEVQVRFTTTTFDHVHLS